uniref:Uncharacterized protein n=1 Tax=Rhizophora mucronata TaxID=61149 RepID=A0A2P2QYF3_RHIMU
MIDHEDEEENQFPYLMIEHDDEEETGYNFTHFTPTIEKFPF